MSWDVALLEVPVEFASVSELSDNFEPRKFPRSSMIAAIQSAFPNADFSDPSWGLIDGEGWSIEVNIGDDEWTAGPMLHVRGGDGAVSMVARICDVLGLRGIDCSTGEFLTPDAGAESFDTWRKYRDQVTGAGSD